MAKVKSYDLMSRINHWVIAIAIIAMLCVGLYLQFGGLEREEKGPLRNIHKAAGVLILFAVTWRVLWRLLQGFPESASAMPRWQSIASTAIHWALLFAIILMPLSGLISSVFGGRAVDVFGLFSVPAMTEIEWLASLASSVHTILGRIVAVMVLIHIAGALKHHFVDKDVTLVRMLTGRNN